MLSEPEPDSFFGAGIDIALILTAVLSSLISLTIPYLYYLKKECRQHPTVLIANIAILQATANYNIILMAYNVYAFENLVNIKNVFHSLTFFVDLLPTEEDFCETNYLIYLYLQMLSISFHLCYSIDLFLTLKYPFLSGKKRRKIYYLFSLLYPVAVTLLSIGDSKNICDTLEVESIYYVPRWFLYSLFLFAVISIANIFLRYSIIFCSFFTTSSHCKIRQSYIRLHRTTLACLLLTWICPIWNNIHIHFISETPSAPATINILAFFSIVSSSGVVTLTRIVFDDYIRRQIVELFSWRKKKIPRSEYRNSPAEEEYLELEEQSKFIEDVWNLPLSGALSEFQSQEVVHNILQVVCEACSPHHRGRESMYTVNSDKFSQESIYRNTVHVQRESQSNDEPLLNILFNQRRDELLENKDPNECDQHELKEMSRRNKRFEMVCTTQAKTQNNQLTRLKEKTVRIKDQMKEGQQDQSIQLDIKVCSYAHRVFESIRLHSGLAFEQLERSLDLEKNVNQIRKAKESLGASGSFFFFSFDNKLVIKTISEEEKEKMVELLPLYHQHLRFNQHSLFTRIYGIFAVEISQISKIYFLMMENSLKNMLDNNIQHKLYDLKGSTIQRQVSNPSATVFKDINYFKSPNCFIFMTKANKVRFLDILAKDLQLLRKFNLMDYSLLLAVGKSKAKRRSKLPTVSEVDLNLIENYRYVHELQSVTRRIYSLSLIDYLQEFNLQKKMELWLKRVFQGGGDISSVGTDTYLQRFTKFMRRIIVTYRLPKSMPVRKMSTSSRCTSKENAPS